MNTLRTISMKVVRVSVLATLTVLILSSGGAQAQAATKGKLTDVGGAFICDCTNAEASCWCIQ